MGRDARLLRAHPPGFHGPTAGPLLGCHVQPCAHRGHLATSDTAKGTQEATSKARVDCDLATLPTDSTSKAGAREGTSKASRDVGVTRDKAAAWRGSGEQGLSLHSPKKSRGCCEMHGGAKD